MEHYQTVFSHIHHAPQMGIPLPQDFDFLAYKRMDKAERIQYAKEKVPRETIIAYQNVCGLTMSYRESILTEPVRGFAGKRKANVGIVIQEIPNTNKNFFSISVTKDNGQHILSYPLNQQKIRENIR